MKPVDFSAAQAANPERCTPECPGWVVDSASGKTQRCDECWSYYAGGDRPTDQDAARARRAAIIDALKAKTPQ